MGISKHGSWLWDKHVDAQGRWRRTSARSDLAAPLAAVRRGAGEEPGSVPSMWPHHVVDVPDRWLRQSADAQDPSPELAAEHHALVLFGYHQQGQTLPVHRPGARVGQAMRRLHTSDRYNREAVDRRFFVAVSAHEVQALAYHLRGLFRQLRTLKPVVPIDYTLLVNDLHGWQWPDQRDRVRRRWGLDYHRWVAGESNGTEEGEADDVEPMD